MDSSMDDHFDFNSFINWPDDLPPPHDTVGGEDGESTCDQPLSSSISPIGWPMTQDPLEEASFGRAQPLAETIPGYLTDTANKDNNQVTAVAIASQVGVDTPSLNQESSSTSLGKKCACIVCLEIGTIDLTNRGPYQCPEPRCDFVANSTYDARRHEHDGEAHYMKYSAPCRLAGCNVELGTIWSMISAFKKRASHEKSHFSSIAGDSESSFACAVQNCRFGFKRWPDLCRHTTAAHCSNPPKFACSMIGCKYNGEGNGFTRKDKLRDHYKSMHQGQKIHGQALRAIKPAPASSHAEASGSSSISA